MVLGPTASGKTALGVQLAREFGGEIVSADSRQVYRGLTIGAGKDLDEYTRDGAPVRYHLIDIVDLDREYSVYDYQQDCYAVIDGLRSRGVLPVIVGGTGLYLEAILEGYKMVHAPEDTEIRERLSRETDEELAAYLRRLRPRQHNVTDLADRGRMIRAIEIALSNDANDAPALPPLSPLVLGTRWDRPMLHERIDRRLRERLDQGLIEEVQGLLDQGAGPERLRLLGLEYRFVTDFLEGRIQNRNDLYQKLRSAIINFAKRQETWFRRMERRGTEIHWVAEANAAEAIRIVRNTWTRV